MIDRLLEYKKYKEVTNDLKKLEEERKNYFSKAPSSLKDYVKETHETADVSILINAFNALMNQKKAENIVTKTTTKEYSVTERSREIKNILKFKKKVEFKELFEINSRDYIIVTFLALLEMVKSNEVTLTQENNFANIYIMGGNNESSY